MVNNSAPHIWDRLSSKQLDQLFKERMIRGLRCSPFEAEAVLQTVHQTYSLFFQSSPALQPGQILIQVVAVEAPPGPRLVDSKQVLVVLTLEDPSEDLPVRKKSGVLGLRRHRLMRVCHEALQQGGLLTVEDLAYRLFNCGQRTLCRDLKALRQKKLSVPLRSTIKDMGRTLSHRRLIVELWLAGKEYAQIARETYHSIPSVQNYIEKFKRVALLAKENFDLETVAFLARLSQPLAQEYLQLFRKKKALKHRRDELQGRLKKNSKNGQNLSNRDY